jgi:hypothetical protein
MENRREVENCPICFEVKEVWVRFEPCRHVAW